MIYCENCQVDKKLNRPGTYPYHKQVQAKCELCGKQRTCFDYPALYVKPRINWTKEEKMLDKNLQHVYHQKAEELIIGYASGSRAGAIDHERTEQLKTAIVKNQNEIDWYATFELRQRIQEGYRKLDESNRMRRIA